MSVSNVEVKPENLLKGFLAIAVAWVLLYWEAIYSAAQVWYVSEIFGHGFFVLPAAAYFIWLKRTEISKLSASPNFLLVPILLGLTFLGLFGKVGDINVVSHFAAFASLPVIIWLCFGNAIALKLWFPLCFILFAVPVGEGLIPVLQRWTADLAVWMLNSTSIPSYSTGLYIEIPQGKFFVAEACSGIRFFIGSLVFGSIYSHFSYDSFYRKCIFMVLSALVPIFANALRVFGIVLVGYYVDVEYAAGADHLIYGWVFFAFVLIMLMLLGETFRDNKKKGLSEEAESQQTNTTLKWSSAGLFRSSAAVLSVYAIALIWSHLVLPSPSDEGGSEMSSDAFNSLQATQSYFDGWKPLMHGQTSQFKGRLPGYSDVVVSWYGLDKPDAELVSSQNSFYEKRQWSLEKSYELAIASEGRDERFQVLDVVNVRGQKRLIMYWYQLEGSASSSRIETKLRQTLDLFIGGKGAGAFVAVSSSYRNSAEREAAEREIRETYSKINAEIQQALPF